MGVFGGDPRFVYLEIVIRFNVLYDVVLLPLIIIMHLTRKSSMNTLIMLIALTAFEVIRMLCCNSHVKGDIPLYVAFLLLTFVPTFVLGFIWVIVGPGRTGFDITCIAGLVIQHLIEIGYCWKVYMGFKYYQDGFYQFSQGMGKPPEEYNELLSESD
jgi:hypothetical protein